MTHRHSLMLTSSMLLLSRERPKINVYSQSSVVYISVYTVNHVLLLCGGEREVPICVCILSPVYLSTMLPVFLRLVSIIPRPSHCPICDRLQYALCSLLQAIKNWTVGRPGNEASQTLPGPSVWQRETSVIYCAPHSPYLLSVHGRK